MRSRRAETQGLAGSIGLRLRAFASPPSPCACAFAFAALRVQPASCNVLRLCLRLVRLRARSAFCVCVCVLLRVWVPAVVQARVVPRVLAEGLAFDVVGYLGRRVIAVADAFQLPKPAVVAGSGLVADAESYTFSTGARLRAAPLHPHGVGAGPGFVFVWAGGPAALLLEGFAQRGEGADGSCWLQRYAVRA
eukprot:5043544-Alexandrium_andersonii.AAC.1